MPLLEPLAPTRWASAAPGQPQARIRLLGDAIVFACAGMQNSTVRHAASLLCATAGQLLRAHSAAGSVQGQVLAMAPMVAKTIHALDGPLVLVDLEPAHPLYRHFSQPGLPGIRALEGPACQALLAMARAFGAGQLQGQAVDASVRTALQGVATLQASPPPLDTRARQLMALLDENPGAALEQLAPLVGLSPHHASRLFSQGMGLTLRRYALSVKIRAAASFMGSGLPLTQIAQAAGFVDSAHFSKVWVQCYGAAPSQFFDTAALHIDQSDQPDWLMWYLARRDSTVPTPAPDAQTPWVHRPRRETLSGGGARAGARVPHSTP